MLNLEEKMMINIRHRQGQSIRQISQELGLSRNTVRKVLRHDGDVRQRPPAPPRPSKLDPFKDYLQQRIEHAQPHWIPSTVLYRELLTRGYTGKERIVRRYLSAFKPQENAEPVQRYETLPGYQLQVDWACFARSPSRVSAFVATLGNSRYSYVQFVGNERLETLLRCHVDTFDYFGGVVRVVLYDNPKTVVLKRHAYGLHRHRFQPALWDLAHHYGFEPKLCRPYRPQTKGKVERFIRYLRESFYHPTVSRYRALGQSLDLALLNVEVLKWLRDVANVRTLRAFNATPKQRFIAESAHFNALPHPYTGSLSTREAVTATPWSPEPLQHPLALYEALLTGEVTA